MVSSGMLSFVKMHLLFL